MRLRFNIRDVLWLTALVALAVGWWLDHWAQVERYQSLLPPKIQVYSLTTADPNTVLKVLQSAMADSPGVRLTIDTKSNVVVALARSDEQKTIQHILNKLEGRPVEVRTAEVIQPR